MEEATAALAIVAGKPFTEPPADLFIPPDALEVWLDSFSGPLDLLLYLIRRQDINILDIPIVQITEQYVHYIQLMEAHRVELAADYLVMAAWLAEIKSRLLLPKKIMDEDEGTEDPRLELIKKLQMYECFKEAASQLDTLPRCERDVFRFSLKSEKKVLSPSLPEVKISLLAELMSDLLRRESHFEPHQILRESLSVHERMIAVLEQLQLEKKGLFTSLLHQQEGRMGLAVTLLAVLELTRQSMLFVKQLRPFAPIYLEVAHYE